MEEEVKVCFVRSLGKQRGMTCACTILQSYPSEARAVVYPPAYWKQLLLSTPAHCAQSVSGRDLLAMNEKYAERGASNQNVWAVV